MVKERGGVWILMSEREYVYNVCEKEGDNKNEDEYDDESTSNIEQGNYLFSTRLQWRVKTNLVAQSTSPS
jgi:hypothetical protein